MTENRVYRTIQWVLWGLLVLCLPVTSFPLVTRLAGGTMVGPASVLPLVLLALIWWLPYLLRRGALPRQTLPLMAFTAAALLSSLISFFLQTPPFQDAAVWRQVAEGLGTLLIGVAFFLIAASWPMTEKRLQVTLQILNWAGLIVLIWSVTQQIAWMQTIGWPVWLRRAQHLFSEGTLYKARITGFAYEPSWLSHQLNMIYIPIWLASSVRRFTAHRWRILGISLENVLLLGGVLQLYLSKSRLGLLAFLLCIAFLLFELSLKMAAWLRGKFTRSASQRWAVIIFYLGIFLLLVGLLVGTGVYLTRADERMEELFDLHTIREKSFLEYAEKLAFSARIVYWKAGWDIFGQRPLLGVGLGNAGFYFYDQLDPYAWELIEVRHYMFNFISPPNIKSLWMRLLAETGILGFTCWLVWLLLILLTALSLRRQKKPIARVFGLAGVLTLLGLLIEGFSLDTFALPYFWVTFGLLVAAWGMGRCDQKTKENYF